MNESFDFERALSPVWDTDTVFDEAVTFVRSDGECCAPLLYTPSDIDTVTNATGNITYYEGIDYTFRDNRIILNKDSRIFSFTEEELYPELPVEGHSFPMEHGNVLFYEGTFFHERQISVTYSTDSKKDFDIAPESKGSLLPRSHGLLKEGKLNLLVYGDSISVGANASGFTGIEPFCPTYAELFCKGLEIKYGAKINYHNPSKGGADSKWGADNATELIAPFTPDLAVVAFGANDSNSDADTVIGNIRDIIGKIREISPECEFIVISEALPNKLLSSDKARFYGNQHTFEKPFLDMEENGIAVADITDFQRRLLTRKRFIDLTGNNVNHPNDFFHRLHAQYLLKLFD